MQPSRYDRGMENQNRPRLLSSGNPQIAKGDGDAPVAAYLEAMPGWKRAIGRRLDRIAVATLPEVRKAVRWNTPLYGKEDGWFFAMYCYRDYLQLTFFRGTDLIPAPPRPSRVEGVRYLHIREDDALDETLIAEWMAQAVRLPGVALS
ncbi:DUF1801 domain-containing protein [Paracoccus beibuensis]|uniref:DUF1801 domain-containing protein n=1 Tax=Paracoccus beibuensis TaxID=547602 RepID=UPI00223FC03C|nr:DUF1801 domain-containing protein [Paracoccus beibuensis]